MSRIALIAIPIFITSLSTAHADSSRLYEFSGFDRIEAQDGLNVSIQHNETHRVEVIANKSDYFDKITIVQKGDSLIVKRREDWGVTGLLSWAQNWANGVQINIHMPELSEVEASSGVDIQIGEFELDRLALEASSGASVVANGIIVNRLALDTSSGASLEIEGSCSILKAEVSSGASISAANFACVEGDIEASSGGSMQTNLSESVNAEASSGGSIEIVGKPNTTKIEKTFGGSVTLVNHKI